MVETHTISAPEKNWEQVYTYAKKHNISVSAVTKIAWEHFFTEEKSYRFIDLVIILLLFIICILVILGVWSL